LGDIATKEAAGLKGELEEVKVQSEDNIAELRG